MAPSIRIPEGFVFVPRTDGVARKLLDAAKEIGADGHLSVRTVGGGYHVAAEVAEAYQGSYPDAEVEDPTEEDELEEDDGVGREGDDNVETPDPDVVLEEEKSEDGEQVNDESTGGSDDAESKEEAEPEQLDESWTIAEMRDWAARQEPAIEIPADVTKKADIYTFLSAPAE
jgi:hypothetical protein